MNATPRWPLVFLFVFVLKAWSFSQILRPFQIYTVNEGLNQSSVYLIFQDSKGYLWFGTGDGLSKFNGYNFDNYKSQINQENTLTNSSIRGAAEDDEGTLWIGTDKGLNRMYGEGKFYIPKALERFSNEPVYPFGADECRVYFYIPLVGFYAFDFQTQTLEFLYEKNELVVTVSFLVKNNRVWFYDVDGVVESLDLNSGKVVKYNFQPEDRLDVSNVPLIVLNDQVCLSNSTGIFSLEGERMRDWPVPVKYTFVDSKERIWISTDMNDLIVLDHDFDTLDIFENTGGEKLNFSGIYDIFEDKHGNIWIALEGTGIVKMSPSQRNFNHVKANLWNTAELETNFIKSFSEGQGVMYVGTYEKGLYRFFKEDGRIEKIDVKEINNQTVSSLLTEDMNMLWIGTPEGLFLLNILTGKVLTPSHELRKIRNIKGLYKFSNDLKIITTEQGAYFVYGNDSVVSLPGDIYNACSVIKNIDGNYWFGTNYGLKACNSAGKSVKLPFSFPEIKVRTSVKDTRGNIWLGTEKGLAKIDADYTISWLTVQNGLADNFIYSILLDEQDHLWISSNRGISKINPRSNLVKNYRLSDGIQSWEFNTGAALKTSDGTMYMGGVNGFNYFSPDQIKVRKNDIQVVISWLKVNGEIITLNESRSMELSLPQNTLTIEVAALEFTDPENNQYAFKLEGLEQAWNFTGTRRTVQYPVLPPGKYTLWVKASNPDGEWSIPQKLVDVEVLPLFWQTTWFKFMAGVIIIGLFGLIIYFVSTARIRKRLILIEQQREREVLRNQISRDVHDDIGAGLSKIALMSDVATGDFQRGEKVNDNLIKISVAARDMLNSLQEIIWAINPKNDSLKNMIVFFRGFVSDLFEGTDIEVSFSAPEPKEIPELNLPPDFRRNLFLILKEVLNNVLKHASADKVYVDLKIEKDTLSVSMIDDGVGFKEPVYGFKGGNGMGNIRFRAQQMNGSVTVLSEPLKGTKVIVKIPLSKNNIKMRLDK
ncbi:MAG: two-component regulator propeller domain-containing protein [Brumimicrobium sp.]|nr:two-component regulator propeller domain-containing protein [Brumimicrobium sp.]